MSEITSIEISRIRRNGGTQSRAALDQNTVNEYTEALMDGAKMPAIALVFDGTDYWLTDGFHRVAAHEKLAKTHIEAEVSQGTQRDAVLASVAANATHGLRRTNADKRRATETLLKDAEWAQWSDREIARRAGVSVPLVGLIRREMAATGVNFNTSRQGADGKTYTVSTKPTTIEEPAKSLHRFMIHDKVLYEGEQGWIADSKIVDSELVYQVKFDTPENPNDKSVWVREVLLDPFSVGEYQVGDNVLFTSRNSQTKGQEVIGIIIKFNRVSGDVCINNVYGVHWVTPDNIRQLVYRFPVGADRQKHGYFVGNLVWLAMGTHDEPKTAKGVVVGFQDDDLIIDCPHPTIGYNQRGKYRVQPNRVAKRLLTDNTPPAATTAPTEELKVGDIVRTRINREGTIKEIIGRTVRLEGDSRIHNIEDLTLLSEIKDFDFRVGDRVLVNGKEPIGVISEIKPSQRLVCVTRPNKGGNVTHWMNVNRVQLAPNQTPITAAIEEIKATVTEGQNFELSIDSGQLVITPTPEATESKVIVQTPAPSERAKREYGRGKMTAQKSAGGWTVSDSANNVIATVHGYEEIEQELMAHRIANNLNTHVDTDEQTVKTLQAIAAYDNGEQPFSPFLFDDIARIRTWLTTVEHAAKFEQEDIKRNREKSN